MPLVRRHPRCVYCGDHRCTNQDFTTQDGCPLWQEDRWLASLRDPPLGSDDGNDE